MLEREVEFAVALDAVAFAGLAGVVVVVAAVVVQQQVEHAEQERAAAAGDVGKAHLGDLVGRLAGDEFADGVLDDVADDVFGRVIDATGLADFGFLFDFDAFIGGDDDLAEEAFIDRAEDVDRDGVEVVGRVDVGETFADVGEGVVVHTELGAVEDVVVLVDDAVVDAVEATAGGDEVLPGRAFVAEAFHKALRFDALVFEETEEDEAVESALGEFGQRLAVELRILVLEGPGQGGAVLVEFGEEGFVNALVTAREQAALHGLAARLGEFLGAFLQRSVGDGFTGEQPVDFRELLAVGVVGVVVLGDGSVKRGVKIGLVTAVEDVELLEVGEDGERRLAIPAVADQLKVVLLRSDFNEGFLCFDEEPDIVKIGRKIESIVGSALTASHCDAPLDFDFLLVGVGLLVVVHIPAEGNPELVNEVFARFRL